MRPSNVFLMETMLTQISQYLIEFFALNCTTFAGTDKQTKSICHFIYIKNFVDCPNSTSWIERANIKLTDDYLQHLNLKLQMEKKPVWKNLQDYFTQCANDTDDNLLHMRLQKIDELLANENQEE